MRQLKDCGCEPIQPSGALGEDQRWPDLRRRELKKGSSLLWVGLCFELPSGLVLEPDGSAVPLQSARGVLAHHGACRAGQATGNQFPKPEPKFISQWVLKEKGRHMKNTK